MTGGGIKGPGRRGRAVGDQACPLLSRRAESPHVRAERAGGGGEKAGNPGGGNRGGSSQLMLTPLSGQAGGGSKLCSGEILRTDAEHSDSISLDTQSRTTKMTDEPFNPEDVDEGAARVIEVCRRVFQRAAAKMIESGGRVEDVAIASAFAAQDIAARYKGDHHAAIEWLRTCCDVQEVQFLDRLH